MTQMLTLADELRATSFTTRRMLNDVAGDTPAPAEAAPASLFDMLQKDTKAPSSTTVAVIPTSGGKSTLSSDQMQQLKDVMMLTSFISVASMRHLYQTKWATTPPNITTSDGAADFVQSVANAKNLILTSALGGFLSLDTTAARSFTEDTTSADLHMGFLTTLFDGFSFPPATIKELDGVLSSVRETLDNLKMSWSTQNSTLDHMIFLYYFDKVQGIDVSIPKVRLYFLHIDQSSWTAAVGKSSVSNIHFHMNFIDSVYDMDTDAVAGKREDIKALLAKLTGQDLDKLEQMLSPKVVNHEGG